jgi:spore germination protein KB
MMYATIVATGILFVPAATSKYAHQDMWLSPIWASVIRVFHCFRDGGIKPSLASVVTVVITLVMTNLGTYLLFGKITENFTFPALEAARYISVACFIEHVEVILAAIWVMGMFVKVTVFYYAMVIGLSQWLNLSDYRPVVLPVGFLIVLMGFWVTPNLPVLFRVVATSIPFYSITVQTLIPTVLLLIALLQRNLHQDAGEVET